MSTAPFFFFLASLLIMVRDVEVRFLLVQLEDSKDVAKGIFTRKGKMAFIDPSKCEWTEWNIGSCSATCGEGSRWKQRVSKAKEGQVVDCDGEIQKEREVCKLIECPVNCVWGKWKKGTCSKTCGDVERTDTRTKEVTEAHGGICTGESSRKVDCNLKECPLFGRECCAKKGVPTYCHSFCMLHTSFAQIDSPSDRNDVCKEHEKAINECKGGSEKDPCEEYDGIASGETICCAKSCGSCGGPGCEERPGRKSKCCSQNILSSGKNCGLNGNKAPCIISGKGNEINFFILLHGNKLLSSGCISMKGPDYHNVVWNMGGNKTVTDEEKGWGSDAKIQPICKT